VAVKTCVNTFNKDVSPGISGWTQPLLVLATEEPSVRQMLLLLTHQIAQGTAPGRDMLCSSKLVALEKPAGGIRPVAVGDMIYRLCTKILLQHFSHLKMLLPEQLGVGTKGGVEPIIRLVEKAVGKELPESYTHLAMLDFSNAFNSIDRCDIATGIGKHAQPFFRAAKWAYGTRSALILNKDGKVLKLTSSQGVRQGDPLGPLFFSIGLRDTLSSLQDALGFSCKVVAYLDDIFVLGKSADLLAKIFTFFADDPAAGLKLNVAKCKLVDLENLPDTGIKLLGSCVGSANARRSFLVTKVSEEAEVIAKVPDLPFQQGLLLLRMCLQQNLRHLQRCLKTDDIADVWQTLDSAMFNAVSIMRSSTQQHELDQEIISLPAKLGGLGLLSYHEVFPHAYAAASESSDAFLKVIFGNNEAAGGTTIRTQKSRCQEVFEQRLLELKSKLSPIEIAVLEENCSKIGRKWLSVIPYTSALTLSDFEVSTALHHHTLCPGDTAMCKHCGLVNSLCHEEVCTARANFRLARHEMVKKVVMATLESIPDVSVEAEPVVPGSNLRTDFRVSGSAATTGGRSEYDLTIVSLASAEAVGLSVEEYLDRVRREKEAKYRGKTATPFHPVVMSSGGAMEAKTWEILQHWSKVLSPGQLSYLIKRISCILVKSRAKVFKF
jgi:hypothetical protein